MLTNPYLAFQVLALVTATAAGLVWRRRLTLRTGIGFMAALGVTCILVAYALGFFIAGGKGYGKWGYRVYSLNLLAPFDPYVYGSILSRALPHFPRGPIYPDCSYLGAGVIFLAIFLLVFLVLRWRKRASLRLAEARSAVSVLPGADASGAFNQGQDRIGNSGGLGSPSGI